MGTERVHFSDLSFHILPFALPLTLQQQNSCKFSEKRESLLFLLITIRRAALGSGLREEFSANGLETRREIWYHFEQESMRE